MKESERSFVENEVSGVATCNETKSAISISAEISSAYNLAMQQNFVPLIGAIRLTNSGNYPSDKIKLSITADPAFFEPIEIDVPEIPPAGSFELKEPKLKISADFLLQLKERIKTKISVKIDNTTDSPAFESNVSLLAFNECDGYMYLPELISAFIQPNSPKPVILKRYIFLLRYDKAVYKERLNDQPNPTSRIIIAVNPSIVAIVTVSMCSGLL